MIKTLKRPAQKQVIKSIDEVDGKQVKTHYEILTENGVTTAYSIDEKGEKTKVDPASIDTKHMKHGLHGSHSSAHKSGNMKTIDIEGDGTGMQKRIKIVTSGDVGVDVEKLMGEHDHPGKHVIVKRMGEGEAIEGEELAGGHGQMKTVIIKSMGDGGNTKDVKVYRYDTSSNLDMDMDSVGRKWNQNMQAKAMVGAASGLLQDVETTELSAKAQRKITKAKKALAEAEAAIKAEK